VTLCKVILVHNPTRWYNPYTYLYSAIRKATDSYWNHAAIEVDGIVYEANERGIIMTPWEDWLVRAERTYVTIDTYCNYDRVRECLGRPYDFGSLLVFLPLKLAFKEWLGRKKERALKSLFCSEFVAYCLGWEEFWDVAPANIVAHFTPEVAAYKMR